MNRDFSLIDSNLRRASEGLRALDECARFIFCNEKIFAKIKQIRHDLLGLESMFGPANLLASRVGTDVGASTKIAKPERLDSWSFIRANAVRVQEALRVLEEISALYAPSAQDRIKNWRYSIYQIETELLKMTPHYSLHYHFEQGIVYVLSDNPEEILYLVDKGARLVQLRDKTGDKQKIKTNAAYLCEQISARNKSLLSEQKIVFILNDYPEIAAELPVDGVHIGQDDGNISLVRKMVGSNKIIGRSTGSLEQAIQAVKDGADYIGVGPVYATPVKQDKMPVGLNLIKQISQEIKIPWVAIGGINKERSAEIVSAGAKNFAVIRSAREFF